MSDYVPKHGLLDIDEDDMHSPFFTAHLKIAGQAASNRADHIPVGRHRASISDLRVIGRDGNLTNSTRVRRSYPSLAPLTPPVEL